MKLRHAFLGICLALLPVVPAAGILDWFSSEPEVDYAPPTPEQVATANELFDEAVAFRREGRVGKAVQTLEEIARDYSNTIFAPDALLLISAYEKGQGKPKDAFKTTERLVQRYPSYERFDRVIELQYSLAASFVGKEPTGFQRLLPGLYQPRTAMELFEKVLQNAPYSELAPQALLNIALIAQREGDTEMAIDALDRLINRYPNSEVTPTGYFSMGQLFAGLVRGPQYDQGTTLEAMSYFEDFLILFPESRFVPEAEQGLREVSEVYAGSKLLLGEFYYVDRDNPESAEVFYNEAITVAPDTEAADLARQRLERIEEGGPRPRSKFHLKTERLKKQVEAYFAARWEEWRIRPDLGQVE
jgi:outer membrane protein assembly factor BamD